MTQTNFNKALPTRETNFSELHKIQFINHKRIKYKLIHNNAIICKANKGNTTNFEQKRLCK